MSVEKNLSVEDIQNIENIIGYTFKNKELLIQAFTRSSYVNEHYGELSNEVLEFYGDRALDITVSVTLSQMFGFISKGKYHTSNPFDPNEHVGEGFLSILKSDIVCKKSLSNRIDELDITKYLRAGNNDLIENSKYNESIKEDLFEAICGAVAIDCEWNFNIYENIIAKFLCLPSQIEKVVKGNDDVQKLCEWHLNKFGYPVEVAFIQKLDDQYGAAIIVDSQMQGIQFDGYGSTGFEAKNNAIECAYHHLFTNNERFIVYPDDIKEVFKEKWLEPTLDTAVNIIQEMEQVGILKGVSYTYSQNENDENGNPLWECRLDYVITQDPTSKKATICKFAQSKIDIKKRTALSVIESVFEYYHYKQKEN